MLVEHRKGIYYLIALIKHTMLFGSCFSRIEYSQLAVLVSINILSRFFVWIYAFTHSDQLVMSIEHTDFVK